MISDGFNFLYCSRSLRKEQVNAVKISGEGSTMSLAAHKEPGKLVTASKERVKLQPRRGRKKDVHVFVSHLN